jgi:hypothetical protein
MRLFHGSEGWCSGEAYDNKSLMLCAPASKFWGWALPSERDAIQFLSIFLINLQKKSKNSKKSIKTLKKCIFDIFTLFLAFSTSSQKNLNFQSYLEYIQLLTRKFYDHLFFLLS